MHSQSGKPFPFRHDGNYWVQGLWIGERLSDLHRMCVESFLAKGHGFALYSYESVANVPAGVTFLDASTVVPSSLIYQFDGSYAGFSDLFRNKLLHSNGGWYVDLDIYCLRPFDIEAGIVFSLARYDPGVSAAQAASRPTIGDGLYVATNPCKLPRGHALAGELYGQIFKKVVFERLREFWGQAVGSDGAAPLKRDELQRFLQQLNVLSDFESHVIPMALVPAEITFDQLLQATQFNRDHIGQKTWGEIGPLLLTKEVIASGLQPYTTPPEMFQGIISHFDVEKYLDPEFDFESALEQAQPYSLDLFFTMWRNKGLLDRMHTGQRCLLAHMRNAVGAGLQ